ncbi:MAG: tetratricopeptide repeat protein [Methanotrichaceae archaeon]|nr:tetratricopeptide repeat protein [Methanotrichaceae archaeon]
MFKMGRSTAALAGLLRWGDGARFAIVLLALASLCIPAQAEEENSVENSSEYWLNIAYGLSANGSYEEAIEAYDKAILIDPENGIFWINKANSLGRLNRTDEAIEAYQKALDITNNTLKTDPQNCIAWSEKGLLLHNVGNFEEAVRAFDNATDIDPEYEMAWMMKGVILASELHRYDEAVLAFDGALQANPEDAQAWSLKGDALKEAGRRAEAETAYARARELEYETTSALSLAITNVVSLGEDELIEMANSGNEAQTFEGLILTIDGKESVVLPDFALGPGERIRFHLGEGESNETDVYLMGDLALDDVAGNLTLRNSTGTLDKFAAYWTPEETSGYWIEKGRELQVAESYEDALHALNNATDINPQNSIAWLAKARILGPNLGRYNQSLEACERALDINPENPEYWQLKGLILMNLGRDEEALAAFEEAIELGPQHGYTWYLKGNSLKYLGRENEAEVAFARAKELGFTSPLAGMIALTNISAEGGDEFVEIENHLDEARSLGGWTLVVDDDETRSVVLPEYTLEPAGKVRVHFQAGEETETNLFMNSEIALNDTATNVTLRDESGRDVSFLGFENMPDGVVMMRGTGEFEDQPS